MAQDNYEYDLSPDPAPQPKRRVQQATVQPQTASAQGAPKTAGSGAFVRGNLLVVKDGAMLPDRCIKCNAPAADGRTTRKFAYNENTEGPGAARMIPFVGRIVRIIWVINQMRTRQYLTVSYCLCKAHRARRTMMFAIMGIGMLIGLG
ncbi:MAG TPA: hypothetical protein VH518_01225, partial [Tepidisphaeraceae bacterium]